MVNRSKQRGTAAETAVVRALHERGYLHAERRALAGALDKGDVALGIPGVMIEVKNCATVTIPAWLREVAVEKANARADIGVVWHKIRGKGDANDWAVTMTGAQFLDILQTLGYQPAQKACLVCGGPSQDMTECDACTIDHDEQFKDAA